MELLWVILFVPLIYFPSVAVLSLIAAIFAGQTGKKRETFWNVFGDFTWELLNPLNWLD